MSTTRVCQNLTVLVTLGSVGTLASCSGPAPQEVSTNEQPLILGSDDRQEPYAYPDTTRAARMVEVSAAIVSSENLLPPDAGGMVAFSPDVPTVQEDAGVCPDERFADQILGASCSGTLIADDLVLTAGHCVADADFCSTHKIVFGYRMLDASTLASLPEADVYDCNRVVVSLHEGPHDYAVIELSRPALDRQPALVRRGYQPVAPGDTVLTSGYPAGIPLKITDNGAVTNARADRLDFFETDLDIFKGNSGGGVFLANTEELVGVVVRGLAENNYVDLYDEGCTRSHVEDDSFFSIPDASYAATALDALCAVEWRPELCSCGDGTCDSSLYETSATCATDCGSVCGDEACNGNETGDTCYTDCGACGNDTCEPAEMQQNDCPVDCAPNDYVWSSSGGPATGDVNADGVIDIVDGLLTAQHYVGLDPAIVPEAAEVDCDGAVTIVDALLIAQHYVGLVTSFPCQRVAEVAAGGNHTCARLNNGNVRCWGENGRGQLGYGHTCAVGSTLADLGNVYVGKQATGLALGPERSCALHADGTVRCWGSAQYMLGYMFDADHPFGTSLGDDEWPASAGDVNMGATTSQVAVGDVLACALADAGSVRCWGFNLEGFLGYGHQFQPSAEPPADMGVLSLGGSAQQIAAGMHHACAILDTGDVRCWGSNWTSQLGYPGIDVVGDDETPADMPTVSLGGTVEQLALGSNHSCALLEGGSVRCWGQNGMGQLGISGYDVVGDDEDPADAPVLQLGGPAQQVVAGNEFSCALMEDGTVRCWGRDDLEQLGGADPVVLPTQAVQIAAGEAHVCAVLETGDLLCWGDNSEGQLGNGSFDLACP